MTNLAARGQTGRRMAKKEPRDEPTQKTWPRGKDAEGKPAKPETIPVPTRGEFFRDLKEARSG